jgi:hypothetical protein
VGQRHLITAEFENLSEPLGNVDVVIEYENVAWG